MFVHFIFASKYRKNELEFKTFLQYIKIRREYYYILRVDFYKHNIRLQIL